MEFGERLPLPLAGGNSFFSAAVFVLGHRV
jgi:hypothetical protein